MDHSNYNLSLTASHTNTVMAEGLSIEILSEFQDAIRNKNLEKINSLILQNRDSGYLLYDLVLHKAVKEFDVSYVNAMIDMVKKVNPYLVTRAINTFFGINDDIARNQALIHAPYEGLYDASANYIDRDMTILKLENPLLYTIRSTLEHPVIAALDPAQLNFTSLLLENANIFKKLGIDRNLETIRYLLHSKYSPFNSISDLKKLSANFMQNDHLENAKLFKYCAYHPEMKGISSLNLDQYCLIFMLANLNEEQNESILQASKDKSSNIFGDWSIEKIKKSESLILLHACINQNFNAFHFALTSPLMPVRFNPAAQNHELFKDLCLYVDIEMAMEPLKYLVATYNIKLENRGFLKIIKSCIPSTLEYFMRYYKNHGTVLEIESYMDEINGVRAEKKEIEKSLNKNLPQPPLNQKKRYKI